jgi:hypothetical protein
MGATDSAAEPHRVLLSVVTSYDRCGGTQHGASEWGCDVAAECDCPTRSRSSQRPRGRGWRAPAGGSIPTCAARATSAGGPRLLQADQRRHPPLIAPLPTTPPLPSPRLQNLFEQATFENASLCDTADYALLPNGTVTVLNRERQDSVDGPERALTGYATCPDGPPACTVHLQVSPRAGSVGAWEQRRWGRVAGASCAPPVASAHTLEPHHFTPSPATHPPLQGVPVGAPYYIVNLGPIVDAQYQWAVVSDPIGVSGATTGQGPGVGRGKLAAGEVGRPRDCARAHAPAALHTQAIASHSPQFPALPASPLASHR